MASSPSPAYIPYTPKRHSTQSSIASLSHVQAAQSASSSHHPTPTPTPTPGHARTDSQQSHGHGSSGAQGWLQSPQPQRFASRPLLVNHWNSNSSATSTSTATTTTTNGARSPLYAPTNLAAPPHSHNKVSSSSSSPIPRNTLPFSPSPRPPSFSSTPPPPSGSSLSTRPNSPPPPTTTTRKQLASAPFQPPGLKRDRTESFFRARRQKRSARAGEDERLERRLDKLLELHFPTTTSSPGDAKATGGHAAAETFVRSPSIQSAKQLLRLGLSNLGTTTGAALSGSPLNLNPAGQDRSDSVEKKHEEQKLVQWESDRSVKECRICSATFGLLTRKHHCRLCGRIVCFLPPTPPTINAAPLSTPKDPIAADLNAANEAKEPKPVTRRERCSTFFTYVVEPQLRERRRERESGGPDDVSSVRETDEKEDGATGNKARRRKGLIVEVAPPMVEDDNNVVAAIPSSGATTKNGRDGKSAAAGDVDRPRKKVRVCRDCLNTILRHQFSTLPVKTPAYLRLYTGLKQLEREIEESLVEFQELAWRFQQHQQQQQSNQSGMGASESPPPSISQTASLRARLLTNLASYDTLSKRLLSLSTTTPSKPPRSTTRDATGPDGELERLQKALAHRSMNWLSEKLSLLRSLGSIEEISGRQKKSQAKNAAAAVARDGEVKSLESLLNQDELRRVRERIRDVGGEGVEGDAGGKLVRIDPPNEAEEKGHGQMAVLREQEKLVQSYLEDANARRQFEDAASLQASLDELRGEIERLRMSSS